MKLLSVAVPCYNSESYMRHCVDTLVAGGENVEVLIIDDGSTDRTGEIADELQQQYPGIVCAIHQENAGHGGAVMTGLANASGLYFRVVDSDDWVDESVLKQIMERLREFSAMEHPVDLVVSNYIYDKVGAAHKKAIRYLSALPENRVFTWDEVKHFRVGQYMLMHALTYRTELLRETGFSLPTHTFYVDNLFAYAPMASVKTLFYLNGDLYHYFIGREDQSVQEQTMIKRIDQQLLVNRLMLKQVDLRRVENRKQAAYLYNYLDIVTAVSSVLLIQADTPKAFEKKQQLWQDIHREYPWAYRRLRHGALGIAMNLPGRLGRRITSSGYRVSQKIFGFN